MTILLDNFGSFKDHPINRYTLENGNGIRARIIDYGGIVTELHVPGKNGIADVALGFDTIDNYLQDTAFIGAIVGRCANRIAGAKYNYEGQTYQLDLNEPPNHLHGGFQGFHCAHWHSDAYSDKGDLCLRLHRLSRDSEGGYPGNLEVTVIYRLTTQNTLSFEVSATTDIATPVSIAQHCYFNLAGHNSGDIGQHELMINADMITPVNESMIPTGEFRQVSNTRFDFRKMHQIGQRQNDPGKRYDTNYCLNGKSGALRLAAELHHPLSARRMSVSTTLPGLQFYDGNNLNIPSSYGKDQTAYMECAGLCLETQHFPDAVNQQAFPSPLLLPGARYEHSTTYSFT